MRSSRITAPSGTTYRHERMGTYFKLYETGCLQTAIAEGKLDKLNSTSPLNYWWIRKVGDRAWLRTDAASEMAAINEAVNLVDGWRQSPGRALRSVQVNGASIE